MALQIHNFEHDRRLPDEKNFSNRGVPMGRIFEEWKAPRPLSPSSIFNSDCRVNSQMVRFQFKLPSELSDGLGISLGRYRQPLLESYMTWIPNPLVCCVWKLDLVPGGRTACKFLNLADIAAYNPPSYSLIFVHLDEQSCYALHHIPCVRSLKSYHCTIHLP